MNVAVGAGRTREPTYGATKKAVATGVFPLSHPQKYWHGLALLEIRSSNGFRYIQRSMGDTESYLCNVHVDPQVLWSPRDGCAHPIASSVFDFEIPADADSSFRKTAETRIGLRTHEIVEAQHNTQTR